MSGYENDGRFPDESEVQVRFPGPEDPQGDRELWSWLSGTIEQQCGPDEWLVTIEDRSVATQQDGSPAPEGTAEDDLWHPACYRDSSELRQPEAEPVTEKEAGA